VQDEGTTEIIFPWEGKEGKATYVRKIHTTGGGAIVTFNKRLV
jgi:hypothetical protein